jgi:hypothetical protein
MSYTLKYRYSFNALDGNECRVDFYIKDAAAGLKYLNPGERPFILREFNSDNDFWKPVRPFIAEMEILSNNVSMDDFLNAEDDGVQVQFYFNNSLFWAGWLIQDDFQENWIDTNHYITLRATDGLGTISSDPFPALTGQQTMLDYLSYCVENTALGSGIGSRWLICNLFYDGMLDRSDGEYTPLLQATVDAKTFEGDTKDKILEKVLRAWSMTCYQYKGEWWFARLEEWINGYTIKGLQVGLVSNDTFTKTFEANIGVNQLIKPIMPEMLRSIRRPSKRTRVEFYYRFPDEILCNQSFSSGSLIIPTTNTYTVDCWTLQKGSVTSPTTGTTTWYRKEVTDLDGNITDNYVFIAGDATLHWIVSDGVVINSQDSLNISFEFRAERNTTVGPVNLNVAQVKFVPSDASATLWLDDDGTWNTTTKSLTISYTTAENYADWKTKEVTSKAVPKAGTFYILLQNTMSTNSDALFKGLGVEIKEASKQPGVIGDYDVYTLTDNVFNDYTEESFLDDSNNRSHKGALHFDGDLTGDRWYRMDLKVTPGEALTFKRHNAIAKMLLNNRYRQKLEVNMLGNTWTDAGTVKPIWLQNKFIFVDDAPTRKWMITNLSEMDFKNTTWKANLLEVLNTGQDSSDPTGYPTHTFGNIYEKDK